MAPFDFDEFEERMNRAARRMENGLSQRAKSFEDKMEDFRKRMEKASVKQRLKKVDIPGVDVKNRSSVIINGTKIIMEDGKLTINGKSINKRTNRIFRLFKLYAIGLILAIIFFLMMGIINGLMKESPKPKPLDINPPTIEQTLPSAEEHPETVLKKRL